MIKTFCATNMVPTFNALFEAERTAKQAQHITVIEAIGSFKEAETVVRQVAVLEEIVSRQPSASLQDSVAAVEARQAQKLQQAREGIKALDALERGIISEETYLKRMDVIAVMDTMTREDFDKKNARYFTEG